jgi:hypothetical protein
MSAKRASAKRKQSRPVKKPAKKTSTPVKSLKWNPRVACRTLDGTAFILLNSRMLRLNEVGTYIWERFEDGATLERVVDGIVSEFDTTPAKAKADAQAFVKVLVAKEVLVPVASKSPLGRSL